MNTISIITPSFNQGGFLEETIQGVLLQQGDFYIDYIIMDGGSSDNSTAVIEKYEHLLQENCRVIEKDGLNYYVANKKDFPWNRCQGISYRWQSQPDKGQVDALNQGLSISKGRILAYINSDDRYYPDAFKRILAVDWNGVDFVYGQGMWISEEGEEILLYPTFKPTKYNFYYQCTLCQPTVFFTREVFQELGAFSMEFQHVLDYEYWMRAIFQGKTFLPVNATLACSRMYRQNKSLAQTGDVRPQINALKKKYYGAPGKHLSKGKFRISKYNVQRKTVNRVNKLHKYLGTGIRYKFWFN